MKLRRVTLALSAAAITAASAALVLGVDASAQSKAFKIGVSNGFVGSEWRTQMFDNIKAVFAEYQKAGLVSELVIQSADADVPGQVQQIRNLINAKVDGIIINPNSQTALNPVIKEASDAGIKVVVVDQEVTSPNAVNVAIDQTEWARIKTRWLADALGGKGNIVVVNGIAGHPANEARVKGTDEVLAKYPDIKVLNRINGDWDHAKAQQALSAVLAAQPDIDGVWTQDGMGQGVLRALIAAKPKKMPAVSGEAYVGFMKLWTDILKDYPDFKAYGLANPPGVGGSGLRVLVSLLQGKSPKPGALKGASKNTIFVPIPAKVEDKTRASVLKKLLAEGKADTYTMDGVLSQAGTNAFFK